MGLWFRRFLASVFDVMAVSGLALGCARLLGIGKVPITADFLLILAALALGIKTIFGLNEGLIYGLGRLVRGPAANWDGTAFGWLYRRRAAIALLGVLLLVIGVVLEVGLRLALPILPAGLANELDRGYTASPGGIYLDDPARGLEHMKPNFRRKMFFSGYRWMHQSDGLGFRNPVTPTQADVVLLGDSMIYGHGLEENETVAAHLRAATGRSVANLGQQGTGVHEEYQFFIGTGRALKPRWVFLCVLNNDLDDTSRRLSPAEQRRFIELPDDDFAPDYVRPPDGPRRPWLRRALQGWSESLYLVRAKEFLFKAMRGRKRFLYDPPSGVMPAAGEAGEPFVSRPELNLALDFQAKAFRRLRLLGERDGFQFVVIYLHTMQKFDDVFSERFGAICEKEGIPYHDFRGRYEQEKVAGRELFLPRDGHYNVEGARVAAEELVRLYPALDTKNQRQK